MSEKRDMAAHVEHDQAFSTVDDAIGNGNLIDVIGNLTDIIGNLTDSIGNLTRIIGNRIDVIGQPHRYRRQSHR